MKYLNYQKMYAQENFTHHYPLNLFHLRFCLQRLHEYIIIPCRHIAILSLQIMQLL